MCHARTIYSRVLHVKYKMYEISKKFDFLGMVTIYYEGSYRGGRRKRPTLEGFGGFEGFISETPVRMTSDSANRFSTSGINLAPANSYSSSLIKIPVPSDD